MTPQPNSHTFIALTRWYEYQDLRKRRRAGEDVEFEPSMPFRVYQAESNREFHSLILSDNAFTHALVDFYANHLSVSALDAKLKFLVHSHTKDAIAAHINGRYSDMLTANYRHPAMLIYLDNQKSIGPDSRYRQKNNKGGINENLAREILELHTLGIDGGYTQSDIVELAYMISGWSFPNENNGTERTFLFKPDFHQPGEKTFLGKTYHQGGVEEGERAFAILAQHPSTARFLSTKLITHFISDTPPQTLIDQLSQKWIETQGNLPDVHQLLGEFIAEHSDKYKKFKSPREYLLSVFRALPEVKFDDFNYTKMLKSLGQAPYMAGSPAGYASNSEYWNTTGALLTKIDLIDQISQQTQATFDDVFARSTLPSLSNQSYQVIKNAAKDQQLKLLFLSPEFLWRS